MASVGHDLRATRAGSVVETFIGELSWARSSSAGCGFRQLFGGLLDVRGRVVFRAGREGTEKQMGSSRGTSGDVRSAFEATEYQQEAQR
jgi:hypothetical protein